MQSIDQSSRTMNQNMITLPGGDGLPSAGLGFWKIEPAAVPGLVVDAIKTGYRHLDCACDYGNESEVGQGLHESLAAGLCRRDELWVTSKLWNTFHRPEHVRIAAERSLRDLGLDYLDLYLIHFPIAQRFVPPETRYPPGWFFDPEADNPRMEFDRVPLSETWVAMEQLVHDGLVRHIGVCNYSTGLLRDLLNYCSIRPSVLQVESHPRLVQSRLLQFCQQEQIAFTAFSPLGSASYVSIGMAGNDESLIEHALIREIAARHERTAAQILLRWGVQRGTSVVPKTSRVDRLAENLALFDFQLTQDEMQQISGLDLHRRYNDPGDFCQSAFNTFCPIYD